ncbi:hypothetical protein FOCC_FOCC008219 [Frankliniella occidentalis]|nr:hypothetical protein FOCC_FOCC008219 [Frankliniella occidentalis]
MFSSKTLCSFSTATALITVFPVPVSQKGEKIKFKYFVYTGWPGRTEKNGMVGNRQQLNMAIESPQSKRKRVPFTFPLTTGQSQSLFDDYII